MNILPRRLWILLFLGFSSGLPLALTSSTLSAWYTQIGVSILGIGLLSLIGQPYIYKFLWAPVLDRFDPLGLGRRRSWMLITQILLFLSFWAMAQLSPLRHPFLLPLFAFLSALFSATQDISISAYLTEAAQEQERGLAAAFYNSGYRLALIIATSVALVLAQYQGWRFTYEVMAALMGIGLISSVLTPRLPYEESQHPSFSESFLLPFQELWRRLHFKSLLIVFIILVTYKLTDALALALNYVLLLRDLHFSLAEVGLINKGFGLTATIIGSLIGGLWMRRLKLWPALMIFGVLQALSNFSFIWLYHSGHQLSIFASAVFIDNFFNGMGNSAYLALVMTLCNKEYSGTQYAFLSALMAVGRVYIGPVAALLVDHVGWTWYYLTTVGLGLFSLVFLFPLQKILRHSQQALQQG